MSSRIRWPEQVTTSAKSERKCMCLATATVDATTLFRFQMPMCCPSQVVGIGFLKREQETYSTTCGTQRVWQLASEVLKYMPLSSLESVERGVVGVQCGCFLLAFTASQRHHTKGTVELYNSVWNHASISMYAGLRGQAVCA